MSAPKEIPTAEDFMASLRVRGLIKDSPNPAGQQMNVTHGALALAAQPAPLPRRLYTSEAQYHSWSLKPASMTEAEHTQNCQSGQIITGEEGSLNAQPCPRCQAAARAADLRCKLVAAGVDGRYLDADWSQLQQIAPLDRLAEACGNIDIILDEGESLLLWSEDTGSGKTQSAMLAAKAAVTAGRTALVVNIARLAVEIRDGYGDKTGAFLKESAVGKMLAAPELLVIDDLGAGESDNAAVERRLLYLALDTRQMHRRSTIVTSNVSPKELVGQFGARILARLSPLTIIHVDHGKNFRLKPGRKSLW